MESGYTSKQIWKAFGMSREWLRETLRLEIITPSIFRASGTGQNHVFSYWDVVAFGILLKLREIGIERNWIKLHLQKWQKKVQKYNSADRKRLKLLVIPYIDPHDKDIFVWGRLEADHFRILETSDLAEVKDVPDLEGIIVLNLQKIIENVDKRI